MVSRNSRAEELLESMPMKYKKQMRIMIEDYEYERTKLMQHVVQMQQ